jgi:hypothetical protein
LRLLGSPFSGKAGYYTIASINSTDPVQVPGSSTTEGTKLDQGTAGSGTNQQLSFASG